MGYYKDTENNVHQLNDERLEYLLPAGCVKITDEEANPPKTKAQLMSAEIKALSAEYLADIQQLNLSLLSAIANDGATEAAKRAVIDQKRLARAAKLSADTAAVKLKYA